MLLEAIAAAAVRLAPTSETPRLDAELLAAFALGLSREAMLLGPPDRPMPAGFEALVERRCAGEPLAYIVGTRDFWTISLEVAPGVLIPRPDSETLIEEAVRRFGVAGPATILDLGTGSGALLLAALDQWPHASGLGIDRSEAALAIAQANVTRLGMDRRVALRLGNWGMGIEGRFDLILCNPPYIESAAQLSRDIAEHEPASALFAGEDGLDDYRLLAPQIGPLLAPGGMALLEIGFTQGARVSELFAAQGYVTRLVSDLGGRDRCLVVEAEPVAG